MYTIEEAIAFIKEISANNDVNPDTDIFKDLRITGDDFEEMIEKYGKFFSVNISNYKWYFHNKEEGLNIIGGIFFKPPNKRVERIPITPLLLTELANKGVWDIQYPEYKLPKRRYDIITNQIIIGLFIISIFIFIEYP